MKDLLLALQHEGDVRPDDIVVDMGGDDQQEAYLSDLFGQVDDLRDAIGRIQTTVYEIRRLEDDIVNNPLHASGAGGGDAQRERLESMMDDVKSQSNTVRLRLKAMEKKIEEEQKGDSRHSADLRIYKAQHATLVRKFTSVLEDYNAVQMDYREKCKNRIRRQLTITDKQKSPEEVEDMLDEGNFNVFSQGILVDNEQMRRALGEIETRHSDIIRLEKSMKELYDLFMDMATMVQEQGELIDNIEANVDSAAGHVTEAKQATRKAAVYQKKARRKKVLCAILCLVLLGLIALIVGLSVGLK
ncbi:syntaxin-1A-like [Oscarella lobularis]|uniref:syntaxin-1A-like n=1 Tax=Oscarella lobularis TaxID=121494 RepID=UPI0033134CB0